MSNNPGFSTPETFEKIRQAEHERRILHNNIIQRILKLRDKLSSTTSLTEITSKLDELERNVYAGSDLEEIEEEIVIIEKIVSHYFHSVLSFFLLEEIETPETKANQAILHARDTNHAEKAE
jgi:hypothetical protein